MRVADLSADAFAKWRAHAAQAVAAASHLQRAHTLHVTSRMRRWSSVARARALCHFAEQTAARRAKAAGMRTLLRQARSPHISPPSAAFAHLLCMRTLLRQARLRGTQRRLIAERTDAALCNGFFGWLGGVVHEKRLATAVASWARHSTAVRRILLLVASDCF